MLAYDHEDQVDNPNDGKTENETDKTCNYLALGESRYPAAYPRGNGDDSKDNAYDVRKSEVITLSHDV